MNLAVKGSCAAASPFGVLFDLSLGMFCCGPFVPLHTPSNRESAWHLIHLEWDLERDPDLELEELRDRDLEDKKETEPFQYFPNINRRSMTLWYGMDTNYSN